VKEVRGRDRGGDPPAIGEAGRRLKGKTSDLDTKRARVEAALARHASGEPLTEREWTIVQYALGGGCHACGGSGSVTVAVRMPRTGDMRREGGAA
jgi:hypothetical protein